MRDTIIAQARRKIEEQYFVPFEKITAELDERGMRVMKQPKVPLDAVQAVQRALTGARNGFLEKVGRDAIDRAKAVLATASPEAAGRIDEPVTLKLTPRDVAVVRIQDSRVPKFPSVVIDSIMESLGEAGRIQWRAAEKPVRTYSAKETYKVGELVEHPKFGRGTVTAVSTSMPRFDVEFADGNKLTLVHVQPRK
jgi:hypothetical protein